MIKIIDFGSQVTQNIARRIREKGVFAEIFPYTVEPSRVLTPDLEGLVLSGGQFSVYTENAPRVRPEFLKPGVPVLGICYGQQEIAYALGHPGSVTKTESREYGSTLVTLKKESPLFHGIKNKVITAHMSHADVVVTPPEGFEIIAKTVNNHIAAMESIEQRIWTVQFHPEVDDTHHGREILENFITICNAQRTWDYNKIFEQVRGEFAAKIEGRVGIGGLSGGVDSTTVSVLAHSIVGKKYHPIFVDNGLLRLNEATEVISYLGFLDLGLIFVDASAQFLELLRGVTDPGQKRTCIGEEFFRVFKKQARAITGAGYLVQGTLYPDVIESDPVYGPTSHIKRHHNRVPFDTLGLEIIEPFKFLFKDEVRESFAYRLGIPEAVIWRHPFPGPGLAIRIVGTDVTPERLNILRKADSIFLEELKQHGLYRKIDQAFAGVAPIRTTGVMGDEGTYLYRIDLRAVNTGDFMTAKPYPFRHEVIHQISNRIINEVRGVNRVFYDQSEKPPATIEWE